MSRGCEAFLASVIATIEQRRPDFEEISIVCDSANVLPDEVLDLPPAREMEFTIDLVSNTTSISRAPYHITLIGAIVRVVGLGVYQAEHLTLGSSSLGRRTTVYSCALTIDCLTR